MSGIPPSSWQPQRVALETSSGKIVIELYWKHAPRTCTNFAELSRRGYYDKTKFHRIIRGFMIQGGDPTATGKHTIFGRVCEGMTVVANLGMVETGNQDRPTEDVFIKRAYPVDG